MKNKHTKRSVSAVLIFTLLVMLLLPMSVPAASKNYRITTLGRGKWASKSYKYNADTGIHYTYYKISVTKPGRLNFVLSNDTYISIYNSWSDLKNSTRNGSCIGLNYKSDCKMIAVEKGTYYMYVMDGKCKYTFTAAATPTNYCVAKAKALKINTTDYSVFTPRTNFTRWYKITTAKKKKIYFWSNTYNHAYSTQIFDSKLRRIQTVKNGSDTAYCTKAALPKGTYYIRVQCQNRYADEYDYAFGEVATIRWK